MESTRKSVSSTELVGVARVFDRLLPPKLLNARQVTGASAVYTPWVATWLMVYQRLCGNGTLGDAVASLTQLGSDLLPDSKRIRAGRISGNTGGYARARDRLNVGLAQWAADKSFRTLVAESPPSWLGRRVFTMDGSSLSLAPTAELRSSYPPAQNQHGASHWPVLRMVAAHELSSGCAVRPEVGPMYGPAAIGEVALAERLLPRLPAHSVLLADRNFGVFAMTWAARQSGHDTVLRLTEKRFRSLRRAAQPIGAGVWELAWRPSRYDRRSHNDLPADAVIPVQLYEVHVSDRLTLWLVSTMPADPTQLAELYHHRQDIETDLRDYKRTLFMDELRGRSVTMVDKELAAATIAYNLVVLVRRLAAMRISTTPRRLSFARVWSLVKVILVPAPDVSDLHLIQQRIEQVVRMAGQCKLPNRAGRSYPREVIARRRKFPLRSPPNANSKRK